MTITKLDTDDAERWNEFIVENFAPVGAFLESWEWGTFKRKLLGEVARFVISDEKGKWLGCFQMETHHLPLGFTYGYTPRGPVLRADVWGNEKEVARVFGCIREYLNKSYPRFIFVRFEPPHAQKFRAYEDESIAWPSVYTQPRFNQLVTLLSDEALMKSFSRDVRHDLHAAKASEVTVESKETLTADEQAAFDKMKEDTRNRSKKNIYPSENYFKNFIETFVPTKAAQRPYLRYFIAYRAGKPVAIHLNLFFAHTLTYLYGASYSGSVSKRAPAFLHWESMRYARDIGYAYYDIGGVDEVFWKGLTYFKKQFGGQTMEYVGTFDFVIQKGPYALYKEAKALSAFVKSIGRAAS